VKSPIYFELDPEFTDPKRLKSEREKARKLRGTHWWHQKINEGICYYCGKKFPAKELTMDHLVPLARGGTSTKGNIVASCKVCNRDKKLEIPVEKILK
jgi:5-methylcytosine-specific restriction endonuclease McrA